MSDAITMLEAFCRIERMGASAKALVAWRATASERLVRHKGFRDPTDFLARTLDITAGEAMSILATAAVLDGLEATTEAAKTGEMSPRKTLAVATAANVDPEAEQELLDLAQTAPANVVQERSRQVRRRLPRPEPQATTVDHGEPSPLPRGRSRRNARPIYRIDATAIDRGEVVPGERCEAAGVGPITVDEAVELTTSDAFKVAVATAPDDHTRIVALAQLGRRPLDPTRIVDDLTKAIAARGIDVAALINPQHKPTAAQESAVMWLSGGRCQIRGCTSGTGRLEIDHVDPYATSHHTTLEHLALLCGHCHDLKTHQGWTVGPLGPDGRRDLIPPSPPGSRPPPDTS